MLPDVLEENLNIVFCGTAAGDKSALLKLYYAGQGNKFWSTLYKTGLTPTQLAPTNYSKLLEFGIGLTDLEKNTSGMDHKILFTDQGITTLREKIEKYQPRILCFNGKRAAEEFLFREVDYGLQPETIAQTKLFVAPSTSGAANRFWNEELWHELKDIATVKKP
ncbi:MAG: mismatch-specific DNA-glycosylase [candidate division Zixibacteria bacterium]|nr:mismatch-specific DNA-glycosylase [candidate division Zixibacteria bacterium]